MPKYWGKQKVGENNGQLRFVRHHGWRTQARLDQNNGQLHFVHHHRWRTQARLDQKKVFCMVIQCQCVPFLSVLNNLYLHTSS